MTQHVVAQSGGVRKWEDPREALLKYDGGDAVYTAAYKDTQPVPQFYPDEREDEGAEASDSPDAQGPAKVRKVDPRTGMYMP